MQTLNIGASQDITVSKNLFSTTDRYNYLSIGGSHLTFSDNYLDGKYIHLFVGNMNTSIISGNTCLGEGMSLSNCLNNKVRGAEEVFRDGDVLTSADVQRLHEDMGLVRRKRVLSD